MTIIHGKEFSEQEVIIDYIDFQNCKFEKCKLIYNGSGPTDLSDCEFVDCKHELRGVAGRVQKHIASLAGTGQIEPFRRFVRGIFGSASFAVAPIEGSSHLVIDLGEMEEQPGEEDGPQAETGEGDKETGEDDEEESNEDQNETD